MTERLSARERLIQASLAVLSEHGFRGATTRDIADRAGVSEVTLFRQFGTKAGLVDAALDKVTEGFRGRAQSPTDDLEGDLTALAERYVAFIDSWPALADRVLPELTSDPDLGVRAKAILERNADAIRDLVIHHQARGDLAQEAVEDTVRAFLGPLLARASLRAVLAVEPLDARSYVNRFLDGRRG